jgi:hypothetical protein
MWSVLRLVGRRIRNSDESGMPSRNEAEKVLCFDIFGSDIDAVPRLGNLDVLMLKVGFLSFYNLSRLRHHS